MLDSIFQFIEKGSQDLFNEVPTKVVNTGVKVLLAFVIFFIGRQVIKLIKGIVRKSMKRAKVETGVIQFTESFLKAALYVLLIFFIASYLGVQAASIIALLGSAGVAIGLAVQGSLSNFAGGVLILLLKPFKVGDYIIENSGKMEGTVVEIQIFYTRLVTPDNHLIVLPNGNLANNSIVNLSAKKGRRLDILVGISYQSDLKKAKEVLLKMLQDDPAPKKDCELNVMVDNLGDSAVNLRVRCFVENEDYWAAKWRITENIKLTLDENHIVIPFPQVDVHMHSQATE